MTASLGDSNGIAAILAARMAVKSWQWHFADRVINRLQEIKRCCLRPLHIPMFDQSKPSIP